MFIIRFFFIAFYRHAPCFNVCHDSLGVYLIGGVQQQVKFFMQLSMLATLLTRARCTNYTTI